MTIPFPLRETIAKLFDQWWEGRTNRPLSRTKGDESERSELAGVCEWRRGARRTQSANAVLQ